MSLRKFFPIFVFLGSAGATGLGCSVESNVGETDQDAQSGDSTSANTGDASTTDSNIGGEARVEVADASKASETLALLKRLGVRSIVIDVRGLISERDFLPEWRGEIEFFRTELTEDELTSPRLSEVGKCGPTPTDAPRMRKPLAMVEKPDMTVTAMGYGTTPLRWNDLNSASTDQDIEVIPEGATVRFGIGGIDISYTSRQNEGVDPICTLTKSKCTIPKPTSDWTVRSKNGYANKWMELNESDWVASSKNECTPTGDEYRVPLAMLAKPSRASVRSSDRIDLAYEGIRIHILRTSAFYLYWE